MKILNITTSVPLAVTPIGNRYYSLASDTIVKIYTDEGVLHFDFLKGFVTNFRSGGPLVDGFIDQIGDRDKALIYLVHDAMYTPTDCCMGKHPVSRELADNFLREGLRFYGMSKFNSFLVYEAVRVFGEKAYEEDDELTPGNMSLFGFHWTAH